MQLASQIRSQLGYPTQSVGGWLVTKFLKWHNKPLEENAVRLCGILPGDTVLELGHGPGLGLQYAARLLTGPTGSLIGVDYSEYMHQMASKRLKALIDTGKVTLHLGDIAAMPLANNSVDRVFHCNCYYFWPDLRKAASEIHRVMKPGGIMVTTLLLHRVVTFSSKQLVPENNWCPEVYMSALKESGFIDVKINDEQHNNFTFQAIYATAMK